MYKGVELALKHSESWGYHLELEIMINDKSKQEEAERTLVKVANELGVKILTTEEQTEFVNRIDKSY